MDLFLTPNGRIDQPTYWRGVAILGAIAALLWVLSAFVNPFFFMLGVLFWWPWIAVHVKRFHDSGKTGAWTVAMIVGAFILYYILGGPISLLMGTDAQQAAEISDQMQRAQDNQDVALMMEALQAMMQMILPTMIVMVAALTLILGLIIGLLNKTDPNDNQYGPGPGGDAVAFN